MTLFISKEKRNGEYKANLNENGLLYVYSTKNEKTLDCEGDFGNCGLPADCDKRSCVRKVDGLVRT